MNSDDCIEVPNMCNEGFCYTSEEIHKMSETGNVNLLLYTYRIYFKAFLITFKIFDNDFFAIQP